MANDFTFTGTYPVELDRTKSLSKMISADN